MSQTWRPRRPSWEEYYNQHKTTVDRVLTLAVAQGLKLLLEALPQYLPASVRDWLTAAGCLRAAVWLPEAIAGMIITGLLWLLSLFVWQSIRPARNLNRACAEKQTSVEAETATAAAGHDDGLTVEARLRLLRLREPWRMKNVDLLPAAEHRASYRKVFTLGRYKVGKSSVLQWLGVRDAMPDNLQNTKGELYLQDASFSRTIFVDTEGFDQPVDSDEPEFRKQLIMIHAQRCADVILLVVPYLLLSDLSLFMKTLTKMRNPAGELRVIHNLPTFQTVGELRAYRNVIAKLFRKQRYFEVTEDVSQVGAVVLDTRYRTAQGEAGKTVHHLFLADHSSQGRYNSFALQELAQRLRLLDSAGRSLEDEFGEAVRQASEFAYRFQQPGDDGLGQTGQTVQWQARPDAEGKELVFQLTPDIVDVSERLIGDQLVLGSVVEYTWQRALYKRVDGQWFEYRPLLIGLSKVEYGTLEVKLDGTKDDINLHVVYTQLTMAWDDEVEVRSPSVQVLSTDFAIAAGQDRQIMQSKRRLLSHEACFLIRTNNIVHPSVYAGATGDVVELRRARPALEGPQSQPQQLSDGLRRRVVTPAQADERKDDD